MDTLLHAGLSNALAAAVLAVLALLVRWCIRRPALAHALWVLVLVKLVTPPLVAVPVPWPAAEAVVLVRAEDAPRIAQAAPPEAGSPEFAEPVEDPDGSPVPDLPEAAQGVPVEPGDEENTSAAAGEAAGFRVLLEAFGKPLLLVIWLLGSVGWFTLALLRIRRFQGLLRSARPAPPELNTRVAELAGRLGLAHSPGVWLVPGTVSPMLWALGRTPRLLVPAQLWERLDDDQRDALLVHELAHWRRRDHWVRWLEFATLGLYWWHPVVWWARHELHEAEEQCCDAWVVWTLPKSSKAYATALVETVDFLSTSWPAAPALASGLGHVHNLRRRVTMILRGTTPRTLTWAGLLAVLGLAAVLLPLTPSWAQQPPVDRERAEAERRRAQEAEEAARAAQREAQERRRAVEREALERDRAAAQGAGRDDVQAEMNRLRADIERMRDQMMAAERRMRELQERAGGREGPRPMGGGGGAGRPPTPDPRPMTGGRGPGAGGPGRDAPPSRFGVRAQPDTPDTERRLQNIEQRLERLMQEIEAMRREARPGAGGGRFPGETPRPPQPRRPDGGDAGRPYPEVPPPPGAAPRPPQPPRPGAGPDALRTTPPARPDEADPYSALRFWLGRVAR